MLYNPLFSRISSKVLHVQRICCICPVSALVWRSGALCNCCMQWVTFGTQCTLVATWFYIESRQLWWTCDSELATQRPFYSCFSLPYTALLPHHFVIFLNYSSSNHTHFCLSSNILLDHTEIFDIIWFYLFIGRQPFKRRMWEKEEIRAVEKHMMSFITSCRVPGKSDCDKCLQLEKEALQNRNWLAIKFYIKNRITALKHKV